MGRFGVEAFSFWREAGQGTGLPSVPGNTQAGEKEGDLDYFLSEQNHQRALGILEMLEFSTNPGLAIPFNNGKNGGITINRCPFFFQILLS